MQAKYMRHLTPPDDLLEIAHAMPETVTPVVSAGLDVTIYTLPTSICSQRVRLTLEEKGVPYRDHSVNIREFENLQPWYVAMNPRGLVPTLKFGDRTLFDSLTIMLFIDNYFEGPRLSPSDPALRKQMVAWLTRMDEFPVRDLSYRWQLERVKQGQPDYWTLGMHDNVRRAMAMFPEHRDLYDIKIAEWKDIEACVNDLGHMAKADKMAQDLADDMEVAVQSAGYLVGDAFSLADVSALATLMRLHCGCGQELWSNGRRPNLQDYAERLKVRDSYFPGLLDPYKVSALFALEGDCWMPMRRAA